MEKAEQEMIQIAIRSYRGCIKEIAAEAGVSRQAVQDVFSGKYQNEKILAAATKVLEYRKAQREQVRRRFIETIAAI